MKLYIMDIRMLMRTPLERRIDIVRYPLTISGDRGDDEGEWSVPTTVAQYFKQASGYWTTKTDSDGMITMWLMEAEDPNMISWLWRDIPQALAAIEGILKLPLFLGETGTGSIMPIGRPDYAITWKVVERF